MTINQMLEEMNDPINQLGYIPHTTYLLSLSQHDRRKLLAWAIIYDRLLFKIWILYNIFVIKMRLWVWWKCL